MVNPSVTESTAGLVQRRKPAQANGIDTKDGVSDSHSDSAGAEDFNNNDVPDLSLMEEVLLIGLKNKEGYTSFWNDCLSSGLRGCILVELSLRRRIELQRSPSIKYPMYRHVVVCSSEPCGDVLLDEALRHLRTPQVKHTTVQWIEYLSGETWNPLKLPFQMRNVRERIAKSLSEKGVLTTEKKNFVLFDMTTHPVVDGKVKDAICSRIRRFLLDKWCNDVTRMDLRTLALVLLANASDVLENALVVLSDADYDIAKGRLKDLMDKDFETFVSKQGSDAKHDVMWTVFSVFNKCF